MTKTSKNFFTPSKSRLKVGDAVKVIAGQWRGTLDHIYQIDHSKRRVYLQKKGLFQRFDRFAPENQEGKKVREIRRHLDISNVAYYSPERKKITKIGFQKVKSKGETTLKRRVARKFKELID